MRKKYVNTTIWLSMVIWLFASVAQAQETREVRASVFQDAKTRLWINTYGNIRLSDRFFWIAQTHFRFQEDANTPFAGQIGQVYNRHAISYLYSKNFRASLGGVLRVNFNTNEVESTELNAVPEWRIWHEYQFAQAIDRLTFYHRFRFEHRWSKGFAEESDYIYRNRWRYMFRAKVPLNKPQLAPGTIYLAPEAELIMQSGKAVVDSPFEDLRLHGSLGYIVHPNLTLASGLMYSMGQSLYNGSVYKQNWTLRIHAYFTPDLRKVKNRMPNIHFDE